MAVNERYSGMRHDLTKYSPVRDDWRHETLFADREAHPVPLRLSVFGATQARRSAKW